MQTHAFFGALAEAPPVEFELTAEYEVQALISHSCAAKATKDYP